jgi:hypothetical protein
VADRLDADTLAALPENIGEDVPADLTESEVDEAARLLREIAEDEREGEPA